MTKRACRGCLLLTGILSAPVIGNSDTDFGLVDWVNEQKHGYVNPKLEIRRTESNSLAFFAREKIEADEVLTHIPWSIIISSDKKDVPEDNLDCGTVRNLAKELKLGDKSEFTPYVRYLLSLDDGQLPSSWTDAAKAILEDILGDDRNLPPGAATFMLHDEWVFECEGDESEELAFKAAELVMQREDAALMVPLYDLFEHRNGNCYNTKTMIKNGKYHKTLASRTIQSGEQIHKSFDMCEECDPEAIRAGYGTAEIFRDRGVIEKYPQRWTYKPSMKIATDKDGNMFSQTLEPDLQFTIVENSDGFVHVKWTDDLEFQDDGKNYVRRIFRKHLQRLHRYKNVAYSKGKPHDIPQHQWNAIWEYCEAVGNALVYAIQSLVNASDNHPCKSGQSTLEGACAADLLELFDVHYHDLGWEEDDIEYIEPHCSTSQIIEYIDYPRIDERQTNYQLLSFWERESDGDICMNLETTLQICSSYRPHYHEFFVHFPALYIDKIKRVIFVGGGDAMLLHEVLKYPELEKVVGLELDQQVTRKSFNYFKSQPHWDNEKVEWWYGDATKSLPLLPRDYWGSFDLVLVDLSETVMSMSVTGELDIFSALALLLKPEGIMVKNEPYIDQFSNFFDHTIHIFYGTPKICTQVLVMGSNKVDFLHHPLKERPEVERLLLEPLDAPSDRFKYFHDYRKNNATDQGKCALKEGSVTTQQGKKAGILEILEVENVSITSKDGVESAIYSVARDIGLTSVSSPSDVSDAVVVVMKEGYIIARIWAERKYCALDIHLWGAFEKSPALRAALVEALGSDDIKSYRIVAGGMFGSNTAESDKDVIGIQVSQQRNCQAEVVKGDGAANDEEAMAIALLETVDIVDEEPNNNLIVAVLCGFEDEGRCAGADVLAADGRVKLVIPVFACGSLRNMAEDPTVYPLMYDCEKQVEEQLIQETQDGEEVDMVVLDVSAPRQMAQIMASIMSYPENRDRFVSNEHVFVSFIRGSFDSELWRREFLEQYRKERHGLPLFRAEVSMKTADRSLGLDLVVRGTNSFLFLHQLEGNLRAKLSQYSVDVRRITGGAQYYDPEYAFKVFPDSAYDREGANAQGKKSVALGRQSIFQYESFSSNEGDMASFDELVNVFRATLKEMHYTPNIEQEYSDVGDGLVFVSEFEEGLGVLVWDGQKHVDVNLFSTDQSEERANGFGQRFMELSGLSQYLRDDQPRGTGGVMLFSYETVFRET